MSYLKPGNDKTENTTRFIYFKSIAIALVFSMIIFLIVAIIITFTSLSEGVLPLIVSTVMILSIAFSGILTAVAKKKNGLLQGLITGIIYTILILFLLWLMADDFSFDRFLLIKCVIGISSGGIGGMIGVNIK